MVGRTIGKYRIVEQIGRGGMGTVYKAIDETLDRRVAIKILNADLIDQEAVERFRREAMTLAKLNHGRIGAIHELTRDGHDLLMVMEFLEGETFEKLIEHGPMEIPRAVMLCEQVLDALQYAHSAGVIHRDLKPANVMLTPSGDVKVMDFGIARVQGSEHLTTNGFMVGTPAYMAPEQVRGEEVDPRMDLYAIAVVLYRMLTHRLPFTGDTAIAMIHSQLNNSPTPPRQFRADLPDWLVSVIDRGLAKTPADRFQTASEFRAALDAGLTGRRPIPMPGEAETIGPILTPPSMRVPIPASPAAPVSAVASAVRGPQTSTAPPPVPAVPPLAQPTVTLRAPHLATAGALVAALVIGIGVLAFMALRRPATTVVAPPAEQATADATAAPTSPAPATDPAATPAPRRQQPTPRRPRRQRHRLRPRRRIRRPRHRRLLRASAAAAGSAPNVRERGDARQPRRARQAHAERRRPRAEPRSRRTAETARLPARHEGRRPHRLHLQRRRRPVLRLRILVMFARWSSNRAKDARWTRSSASNPARWSCGRKTTDR